MRTFVINREDRPERLQEAKRQFELYDMEVEVFPAIVKEKGWMGCRDSHIKILEMCSEEEQFAVYEDDFLFLDNPIYAIENAMAELPKIWDMLYLGISPRVPFKRHSANLYKVGGGYTTHAIIWNNRKGGAKDYILNHKIEILKLDVFFNAVIHKMFNCFVIYPILCTQWDNKSNTCYNSGVETIVKNYNKFCP